MDDDRLDFIEILWLLILAIIMGFIMGMIL